MSNKVNTTICNHCGSKVFDYRINFDTSLAIILRKLFIADEPVKTSNLGLTHTQYGNATRLAFWGLAEPHLNAESKVKKGWWVITEKGKAFVRGQISIQKIAVKRQKTLLRFEGEHIMFHNVTGGNMVYEDYADQVREQLF